MAKEKLKVIEISRAKWGRGRTGGSLRDPRTKLQCCLGFVCRSYGLTIVAIHGKGMPCQVPGEKLPNWLRSSIDVDRVAEVNDSQELTSRQRESQIKAIFARNGLKAVFTP